MSAEYRKRNTKDIDCPEHPGEHQATLYMRDHRYASMWMCKEEGVSDYCKHPNRHTEDVAINYMSFDGPHQTETKVEVCNDCDMTVEKPIGALASYDD